MTLLRKKKNVVIEKNIGQIFRQFNIVEYKSPNDRATVEAYHRTQCYARLYVASNKADINDVSVTVAATRHPRTLLKFLNRQYTVTHVPPGIYFVEGDTCPTQIIVSEELPESDNLWLKSLRGGLTAEQLERLALSEKLDAYFRERFAPDIALSEARGEARGKIETVLTVLRAKFKKVPKGVESTIRRMTDPIALDSWAVQAATCQSLDEFAKALK